MAKTTKLRQNRKDVGDKLKGTEPSKVVVGQSVVDDTSAEIRNDPVMRRLRKSFKRSQEFDVDFDALHAEVQDLLRTASTSLTKDMDLESSVSIKKAAKARLEIQASRDRLSSIYNQLRRLLAKTINVYTVGEAYVRQHDKMAYFYSSAIPSIVASVLREIGNVRNRAEGMLDETRTALFNLDAKTRAIEDWYSLHRQYVFISGMLTQTGDDDDNRRHRPKPHLRVAGGGGNAFHAAASRRHASGE